jgi:hypothetical protein
MKHYVMHIYETLCNAHNIPNLGVKERDKLHQFHIAGKTLNKNPFGISIE